jgi:hypothetical protein
MPSATTVPPRRTSPSACSTAAGRPAVSITWSAPRASARSSPARRARVAPKRRAASSRAGLTSIAVTSAASASTAPWMAFSPTPPQPTTTTRWPGRTCATRSTAPRPVRTAQPIRQALGNGTSSGIRTAWEACTTTSSANAPQRSPWTIGPPPGVRIGLGTDRPPGPHSTSSPARQAGHTPQARTSDTTT